MEEMTTGQICRMLDDARGVGMTDYIVWGGEPLLRDDLPTVLAYANRKGLDNTLITNGSLLPERIDEIAQNLYGLIVSIDHPEAGKHDQLRRKKGVYRKAIEGIERAKEYEHLNIFINCVIQKGNINQLEGMVKLAKEMGVKITFEMMEVVENYNENFVP
ncbi:MAG: radical SAM protein, partial [Candidatus Bathyarchaeia archaeon]